MGYLFSSTLGLCTLYYYSMRPRYFYIPTECNQSIIKPTFDPSNWEGTYLQVDHTSVRICALSYGLGGAHIQTVFEKLVSNNNFDALYIYSKNSSIVVGSWLLAEKCSNEAFFLFILWKPLFTGGLLLLSSFSLSGRIIPFS